MESGNLTISLNAVEELMDYYAHGTHDQQVSIMKTMFQGFVNNNHKPVSKLLPLLNPFLGHFKTLLLNKKLISINTIKAFIDGWTFYLQSFTNKLMQLDPLIHKTVRLAIEEVIHIFVYNYKDICQNKNISLDQLRVSLEELRRNITSSAQAHQASNLLNIIDQALKSFSDANIEHKRIPADIEKDYDTLENLSLK